MDIKHILQECNIQEKSENILYDEPMKKHTSFKIGGPAKVLIKATKIETIKKIIEVTNNNNIPLYIIGNGSNILVKDEGINGIVLKPQLTNIEIKENDTDKNFVEVIAECGVLMGMLAHTLAKKNITGFEELAGIPGTIGGAIRMNAGAHGKEIKDICIETTYMDMNRNINKVSNKEQQFEYRSSIFKKEKYIILDTKLKLEYGNAEEISSKMEQYANWRKEHQPLEFPNAGSTFKRGIHFITAQIIDECGLKGYQVGGAQVSTKHAGFVINTGNATAQDVFDVINHVKSEVFKQTGKTIELEIDVI